MVTRTRVYLLQHVATGQYMPAGLSRRGYTSWDPTCDPPTRPRVPRLFISVAAARQAEVWWRGGRARMHTWQSFEGDYDSDLIVSAESGRKREHVELRIVEATLEVPA